MYLYVLYSGFILVVFVYIFNRLTCGITRSNTCLVGKTAIITGANSGLGYQTALNLASRGCRIIMADLADMEESKKNIIKYTNNTRIETKKLDLESFASVRRFAEEIMKTEAQLDILINNAGVAISEKQTTPDGLETVMQINCFSHILLTHLLIGLLKKSAPSRIVFASSIMAFFHNLNLKTLNNVEEPNSIVARTILYNNSKYAMLLASDIFADKLKGSGVTSNSIHPGLVDTIIWRLFFKTHRNEFVKFFVYLASFIWFKSPWEGCQTMVHVAVSRQLENVSGKHFWDCKEFFKPWRTSNREFSEKFWKTTEQYIGLSDEEKLCH